MVESLGSWWKGLGYILRKILFHGREFWVTVASPRSLWRVRSHSGESRLMVESRESLRRVVGHVGASLVVVENSVRESCPKSWLAYGGESWVIVEIVGTWSRLLSHVEESWVTIESSETHWRVLDEVDVSWITVEILGCTRKSAAALHSPGSYWVLGHTGNF